MTTQEIQARLENIAKEIGHMFPQQCADESIELVAILSLLNVKRAELKQSAYQVAFGAMKLGESAASADIHMKSSEQYKQYQTFDGLAEAVKEMIQALKKKLSTMTEEEKTV